MKNLINLLMLVLITNLIQSCSSLQSSQDPSSCILEKIEVRPGQKPEIPITPEKAFFPLRINPQGKIVPSYAWRECTRKLVVCLKWKQKIIYFEDLEWFYAGEYGLMKRPSLKQ
jgi:hypothetical protein